MGTVFCDSIYVGGCCYCPPSSSSSSSSSDGSSSSSSSGGCAACGACRFSPGATARITWSFSIDPASPDLNGGSLRFEDLPADEQATFAAVASGDAALSPADLTGIFDGGAMGTVGWTGPVPGVTGASLTVTSDCATGTWAFTLDGPGLLQGLFHDANGVKCSHPLPRMAGTCSGATGANAVFVPDGFREYTAVGGITITISNNDCA